MARDVGGNSDEPHGAPCVALSFEHIGAVRVDPHDAPIRTLRAEYHLDFAIAVGRHGTFRRGTERGAIVGVHSLFDHVEGQVRSEREPDESERHRAGLHLSGDDIVVDGSDARRIDDHSQIGFPFEQRRFGPPLIVDVAGNADPSGELIAIPADGLAAAVEPMIRAVSQSNAIVRLKVRSIDDGVAHCCVHLAAILGVNRLEPAVVLKLVFLLAGDFGPTRSNESFAV